MKTKEELKELCTTHSCEELKKVILENPELPLMAFVSEDAYEGIFNYNSVSGMRISVESLTLYGDYWMKKDEYEERISYDLCKAREYTTLSNNEFDKIIVEKVADTEFVEAIVLYIG